MLAEALTLFAIVASDQTALRAAPRDSAPTQAVLWQGDSLEIRGEKGDFLQVYDHRHERAGYIRANRVRQQPLTADAAPGLLAVLRFLKDAPGSESLGIADMAQLFLLYLLKARELAIAGQEHRAQVQLGVGPEALAALKRMPMVRLAELARSDSMAFTLRTPPQFWKELGQETRSEALEEALMAHRLAFCILGEGHDEFRSAP